MIEPVVLDPSNEVEMELSKISHILIEKGFVAKFGISVASKLPVLMHGTTVEMSKPDKLCFYCSPPNDIVLEKISNTSGDYSVYEIQCMETAAHKKRLDACMAADADQRRALFNEAYDAYEVALRAFGISSITTTVTEINKSNHETKVTMLTAPSDVIQYNKRVRRIVGHCLAGIALCLLMGKRDPMLFFKASSAALCWESSRPLELAAVLRINLLLTARFHMGLMTLAQVGGMVVKIDDLSALDALFDDSNMVKITGVYAKMNELIMVPLVYRIGSPSMQSNESNLIPPDRWEDVLRTAMHFNERHAARMSGAIPDPRPDGPCITTHMADGLTIERTCGRCGQWDRGATRFQKCSRCERAYYCCKACQVADWTQHKPNCVGKK